MLLGRCACKAVEYQVADEFHYAAYCHCSFCRARTGSAYSTFAGIEYGKIAFTKGRELLKAAGDPEGSHDLFCSQCGSTLMAVFTERQFTHVQMGTLVDAPSVRPRHHIFVGSRAPWDQITDGLPQYEGHAP
jgi:hypothetical protein